MKTKLDGDLWTSKDGSVEARAEVTVDTAKLAMMVNRAFASPHHTSVLCGGAIVLRLVDVKGAVKKSAR